MPMTEASRATESPTRSERQDAMLIHLLQLCSFALPLSGLVVPLILWQMKKEDSEWVDEHGRNVVNWQISMVIYLVIAGVLCIVLIGIPLLLVLLLMELVLPILGGLRANAGERYEYPLTIRFLS